MNTTPQQPRSTADPLKQEASIQVVVRFSDQNVRTFYSGDIRYRTKWQYQHVGYWLQTWKHKIQNETPPGWQGRVVEAAIFRNFDGNRGDKIAQFTRDKGWDISTF